jgi:hypothetical protein
MVHAKYKFFKKLKKRETFDLNRKCKKITLAFNQTLEYNQFYEIDTVTFLLLPA